MTFRVQNGLLAALIVACVMLIWNLEPDPTQPNDQFLPGMHYSVPLNPQSENPLMPDGKALQSPPEGTIARGFMPLPFGRDEAGRKAAGRILANPVSSDSVEAMDRGALKYATYCQPCHGVSGEGNGTITRYGFPPPPSFGAPNVVSLKDGEIFHTITYGKGNMPGLAAQVPRTDRWKIILKVRRLQETLHKQPGGELPSGTP